MSQSILKSGKTDRLPDAGTLFPDIPDEMISAQQGPDADSLAERASAALQHLEVKMAAVISEFSLGQINQAQFEAIYTRYSRQQALIEYVLYVNPSEPDLSLVEASGITSALRREHAAVLEGMIIVEIRTGRYLKRFNNFDLSIDMLLPLIQDLNMVDVSAIKEGARTTMIDSGRWLSVVPGEHSCAIGLFSREPSLEQVRQIVTVQHDFEKLNRAQLMPGPADPQRMVYPQGSLFNR
jgi:hypothetical protein